MDDLDDLFKPTKKTRKPRKKSNDNLDDLFGALPKKSKTYEKMKKPRTPHPDGIWTLRQKAEEAGTLGVKCLIDNVQLKPGKRRPPIICRKPACYKGYRIAYRLDYDKAKGEWGNIQHSDKRV